MKGFLGNAKYTRTSARQYQDHVNKSWWMTFLVTQNTRGLLSLFLPGDLQKCMQKPSTYQINAIGEFHFPEKIARVLFLGNLVGSKVLRYGTEKSLIYTRTFHLPAQFSATFLAKCLRVNRALETIESQSIGLNAQITFNIWRIEETQSLETAQYW